MFTTKAFGPFVGFGTGWIYYISRIAAFAANSNLLADYLGSLWSPVGNRRGSRGRYRNAACGALTWANYVGVKDGVRMLTVLTVLKLTPILLLIVVGLPYVSAETVVPAELPAIDELGGTILLMIFAFVGFESTTIVSGESKGSPPFAYLAHSCEPRLFIGLFYFLVVLVYVAVLPNVGDGQGHAGGAGRVLARTDRRCGYHAGRRVLD